MHKATQNQASDATRQHKMQHKLKRLQKLVAQHEPVLQRGAYIGTGFGEIDAYLAAHVEHGGLPSGGVHEIAAASAADMPAALGFAHRLAAQFLQNGDADNVLLYGQTHATVRDGGQPYAPALAAYLAADDDKSAHGLSARQLVYLDGVTMPDLLWAGEQALTCAAVGCTVLASSEAVPDFTHSRRLSLAARAAERPLLLALGRTGASAATTRWRIAAMPGQGWQVQLEKLRLAYDTPPPVNGWTVYPQRVQVSPKASLEAAQPSNLVPLLRRAV